MNLTAQYMFHSTPKFLEELKKNEGDESVS